ncbi:MAG: nucleoside triphosphate pyrophosphohydrolase [Oscillospiraceae bacterium]|nr:nucleoside triphosphate pyrophosphohydrolase [Oscillospiraceae bacterium]MDE6776769.1 nucleoside triphosphate pyrophosphohydrolase [Oscillospiraceae bacterium]MDE7093750.1 nucleoside triphosphate pyrophosphohydrolase [Oscillospiraceae bacterium]
MIEYPEKNNYNIQDLREIVKILRSPEGCPWDKEQNHRSIRNDFLEEAYEAVEAIDLLDMPLLREELGDVLLQVVFHCTLAEEEQAFDFEAVCDEICRKLIIRHPHVFGNVKAETTETVLKNWDEIKKKTKQQESYTDTLNSVAKSLPALARAQKIGKRAGRAGMDFENFEQACSCIQSEYDELQSAMLSGDAIHIEEELGDLLFSCVNTARHLNLDAEQALSKATEKFIRRFAVTEKLVQQDGKNMPDLPIQELDDYWNQAKQEN